MTTKPTTFDEACDAWEPDMTPQPPAPIDVGQVIHALERARDRLQADADAHAPDDYSAEFPSEDAERMREAISLLRGTSPSEGCFLGALVSLDFENNTATFSLPPGARLGAGTYRIEVWAPGQTSPVQEGVRNEPRAITLARIFESFRSSGQRLDGEPIHLAAAAELRGLQDKAERAALLAQATKLCLKTIRSMRGGAAAFGRVCVENPDLMAVLLREAD